MGCAESVHFYGPLLCHKRLCQHGRVADESDGTDIYSRQGGNTKDKTVSSRGPDLSEASDDEAVIEEVLPHSINASADYGDGRGDCECFWTIDAGVRSENTFKNLGCFENLDST